MANDIRFSTLADDNGQNKLVNEKKKKEEALNTSLLFFHSNFFATSFLQFSERRQQNIIYTPYIYVSEFISL